METWSVPDSARVKRHWPFAILAAVSLAVVLANLGSAYLWEDEGDTAVLAANILKFGVPKAWDGIAFMDSDQGARLNSGLVMVTHPWGQYYVAAASFLFLGQNTFAARFPFAVAGWMSIPVVYFFVRRVIGHQLIAFCSALLIALSLQFLLYARQCRHYPLTMFLTCCLFWIFFRMKSFGGCVLFAFTSIALFHMHPYGLVPVSALGGLSFVYPPFVVQRRWVCFAAPVIGLCTLPWLALAPAGTEVNMNWVVSFGDFVERLTQAVIECASVTPLMGVVILLCLLLVRRALQKREAGSIPLFTGEQASFLTSMFAMLLVFVVTMALTQSTDNLWLFGIRYAPGIIPLIGVTAGILIVKVSRGSIVVGLLLLFIFGFTKLAQLTPWMCWNPEGVLHFHQYSVGAHVPSKISERFLSTGLLSFLRDSWRDNPGTMGKSCRFLGENAKPGDVVIANYGWEPLYFYTRLPQAMSILPKYPFYSVARRLALPDYLFGVDHVRWIVWRSAWEGVPGFTLAEVADPIVRGGGRLTRVMEMEETVWENRENIHFYRFSDGTYLFPRQQSFPSSHIFRVDWP